MSIGILFDLDGTLLNTLEDLADSTNAALASFGYPARTLEEVRRFVGNGAAKPHCPGRSGRLRPGAGAESLSGLLSRPLPDQNRLPIRESSGRWLF